MLHLHTYCYRITIRINAYDHSYFLKTNGSESLLKGVNPIGQNLMPLINSEKYIKNCLSQKCAFLNFKIMSNILKKNTLKSIKTSFLKSTNPFLNWGRICQDRFSIEFV